MNEVFDIKELNRYIRCSDSIVRKLIKNREIPNFRIANRIYLKKVLIDIWIQNQCMKSVEAMEEYIWLNYYYKYERHIGALK